MSALILGSGPAGLIAAETLVTENYSTRYPIDIVTNNTEPSVIEGAQFLHNYLWSKEDPDGSLHFVNLGSKEVYANKVYGSPHVPTSFGTYPKSVPYWSLKEKYKYLYDRWRNRFTKLNVDVDIMSELTEKGKGKGNDYDLIISTIPRHCICLRPDLHSFPKAPIGIVKPTPANEQSLIMDDVIIYSGREQDNWYRASVIDGLTYLEYGKKYEYTKQIASGTIHHGYKPLGTDCDCWGDKVKFVGRFGLWDRKILLHHVPDQVRAAL